MKPDLPAFARAMLRVLPEHRRERALADLADIRARVAEVGGDAAARRACTIEAAQVVLWGVIDLIRTLYERGDRERGRSMMLRDFTQDLRFGARALVRRPGFALITTVVLGLGIGANVGIFTLADRLFMRPPSGVHAPEELVSVFRSWGVPNAGGSIGYPDYLDYRAQTRTLEGLAAFQSGTTAVSAAVGNAVGSAQVTTISDNYFDVLGVAPALGRFFVAEENRTPDRHPVMVVSWRFWQDRLGGADPVGQSVLLNGHRFDVIGVAPQSFGGLTPGQDAPDGWIPILMRNAIAPSGDTAWRERLPDSRERWLRTVGRLRPGVEVAAVQTELAAVATRIREAWGGAAEESVLVSAQFRWYPSTGAGLANLTRMLLVTVGLLLAIAGANVAILLLARASTRDREIGIRTAIGAARGRITRQLLAESMLLGGAGCILGLALSVVTARVAAALLPVQLDLPTLPDARVLLFAVSVSFITSLVVGLAPVARAARSDVAGLIHGRDRGAGGGRVRDGLVVLQVALSLVLVAGAALFSRSLLTARSLDVGFDDEGVLLLGVNLRNHGYDAERGLVFLENALDRLAALPGVTIAATTRQVPFRGDWTTEVTEWPGIDFASGPDTLTVGMNVVSSGYFESMGIPLLAGRGIEHRDAGGAQPILIVNETFARAVFGDLDVIGRHVPLRDGMPPFEIVGVARDATYYRLGEDPHPQVYGSVSQVWQPQVRFVMRTAADPSSLAQPAQQALLGIEPALAFESVETLSSVYSEQLASYRATAGVVGMTGLIALLLASAGLYGVMAWRVNQRTREIGLRMALGATRGGVAGRVLRDGIRLAILGTVTGTLAALLLARLVQGLLFGVPARDPLSFVVAPFVLLLVAAAAVLFPARRAMRVDPMTAMRSD